MRKVIIFYLLLVTCYVADLFLPHVHVYRSDPISGSILTSLLISAAITAGTVGLEYLIAKGRKVAPIDRGKQDDIRLSIPGYGESIVRAWGTFRTAPIWVWHTPIVHSTITTPGRSGGKGSPRPPTPTTVDHIYTTSLAGVICEGPISDVSKIWFDTDLVYNTTSSVSPSRYEAESATLAGGANSVASSACSGGFRVQAIGNGGTCQFSVTVSGAGDYDVGVYYTAASALTFKYRINGGATTDLACTSTGGTNIVGINTFTVTLNNGANTIKFENAGAACPDLDKIEVVAIPDFEPPIFDDPRSFTGLMDPAIIPAANQNYSWPYYMHRPALAASTISTNLARYGQPAIRIYTGTETQTADSAIIADKGSANAPAYRGVAYLLIEGIQVPNGRIPNVTLEVVQGTFALANTVVQDIYGLVGVTSGNLSLSAISGDSLTGYIISSRKSAIDCIAELQTRFQFDLPEVDGVVKAVKRNGTSDLTISYTDLRAHLDGEEMPPFDALITDVDPLLLPTRVDVNYLDPALDYHNNTQSEMRLVGPQFDNQSVSLSIVDSANNMKKLAATLLYKPDMEGRGFRITTGPKHMRAHPGSVLTLTLPNATHVMRVSEAKYGLPAGVCEFEGVRQQASIYSPTGTGSTGTGYEAPIAPIPANTTGMIIDGPLLRGEDGGDGTQPVVYVGMSGRGSGSWPGGFLYQEFPIASANYKFVTSADRESGIGESYSFALAAPTDPTAWDRTSSFFVQFFSNTTLSNATEQEVLANPTLNLIGVINQDGAVEYIQFAAATAQTAVAPFKTAYAVSTLLRARLGSTGLLSNVGSRVAVIDATIKPRRMELVDIGRTLKFKFVSSGQAVDDAAIVTHTLRGNSLLPLAPVNLRAFRDAAGNIVYEWTRRSRLGAGMRPGSDVPLGEENDWFELEVYSGSTVLRTIRVPLDASEIPIWDVISDPKALLTLGSDGGVQIAGISGSFGTTIVLSRQVLQFDDRNTTISFSVDSNAATSTHMPLFVSLVPMSLLSGDLANITLTYGFRVRNDLIGEIRPINNVSVQATELSNTRLVMQIKGGILKYFQDPAELESSPMMGFQGFPLTESYKLLVRHPTNIYTTQTMTLRTPVIRRNVPTAMYSANEQVTDFGSTQASIKVRVYQVSALVGRGPYLEATI